jgi:23S rRNA pseudouridine2605 synthase
MEERLQKLIAAAGIASRRHAEELIEAGEVTVNGKVVRELGTKADPARDHIKVRGKLINPQLSAREDVYVLLNKPRGFLTSLSDPENRPLITELVPPALGRLHPVGRLDFNTEGLLILTNDGELTNYVTAARNHVRKVYEAKVKGVPSDEQIERLRRGIRLEDGTRTAPAEVKSTGYTDTNAWYEVVLYEGKNQQIRRMFDAIGHSVVKLRRVRIGDLTDKGLPLGHYRYLTPAEVARLKGGSKKGAGKSAKKAAAESPRKSAAQARDEGTGAAPKRGARKAAGKRGAGHGSGRE